MREIHLIGLEGIQNPSLPKYGLTYKEPGDVDKNKVKFYFSGKNKKGETCILWGEGEKSKLKFFSIDEAEEIVKKEGDPFDQISKVNRIFVDFTCMMQDSLTEKYCSQLDSLTNSFSKGIYEIPENNEEYINHFFDDFETLVSEFLSAFNDIKWFLTSDEKKSDEDDISDDDLNHFIFLMEIMVNNYRDNLKRLYESSYNYNALFTPNGEKVEVLFDINILN